MTTTDRHPSNSIARLVGFGVAAVLLAAPAMSQASTSFGAKLTPDVQPSNAGEAHPCIPGEEQATTACTRVLMDAYGRPDQPNAPKSGKIKRIKLIAGEAGTFRLQIVKANPDTEQAKLVRNGPVINYQGQPPLGEDDVQETYRVEKFKVNVKVKKGQYLAIQSTETSMLRCSSGGPNQLIFSGPLQFGDPFRPADTTDGCWLLLEARIK